MQAETYYIYENVTDFRQCFQANNINSTNGSLVCNDIKDYIDENAIDCSNSTKNVHIVKLGTRSGMNILGIIVFTVAFAITLGRLGEEGQKVVQSIGVLNEAIMKLVSLVMWYVSSFSLSPYFIIPPILSPHHHSHYST